MWYVIDEVANVAIGERWSRDMQLTGAVSYTVLESALIKRIFVLLHVCIADLYLIVFDFAIDDASLSMWLPLVICTASVETLVCINARD